MSSGPERWHAPREWEGDRCFILCGGASLQVDEVPKLRGRVIAIKQAAQLRPDADVMFLGGKDDPVVCKKFFPLYRGPRIVSRSYAPGFPPETLFIGRSKDAFSDSPNAVSGLCAGASAINLAYHLGSREIVLLGMDMRGGRWVQDHHLPVIPHAHFERHIGALKEMASALIARGVRVINCSPITALRCFERRSLKEFL